jgi:DNA polymerase III epsilon subunit-like protein
MSTPDDQPFLGNNLLRFNKSQVYIAADFESTSLNTLCTKPWQLSWVKFTLQDGILEENNEYIWHDNLDISPEIAAMTHFDYSTYKDKAKPINEVLEKFEVDIFNESYKVTGQNILAFDILLHQILRRSINKQVNYSYLLRSIDTLALARAYRKGIKPDISSPEAFLSWQYKMLSIHDRKMKCSLSALNKEFNLGFDVNSLHDALVDNRLLVEVFVKLIHSVEV